MRSPCPSPALQVRNSWPKGGIKVGRRTPRQEFNVIIYDNGLLFKKWGLKSKQTNKEQLCLFCGLWRYRSSETRKTTEIFQLKLAFEQRKRAICHCCARPGTWSCAGQQNHSHPPLSMTSRGESPPRQCKCSSLGFISKWMYRTGACFCFATHHSRRLSKHSSDTLSGLNFWIKEKNALPITTFWHCDGCQQGIKPYPQFFC